MSLCKNYCFQVTLLFTPHKQSVLYELYEDDEHGCE